MLLVCYKNHFNHRICRVLEKPLTPPVPAMRFKVAMYLQLHSVCWIPYVHFHFSWRSHSIPRGTDMRKACLFTNCGRGKLSARRKNLMNILCLHTYTMDRNGIIARTWLPRSTQRFLHLCRSSCWRCLLWLSYKDLISTFYLKTPFI